MTHYATMRRWCHFNILIALYLLIALRRLDEARGRFDISGFLCARRWEMMLRRVIVAIIIGSWRGEWSARRWRDIPCPYAYHSYQNHFWPFLDVAHFISCKLLIAIRQRAASLYAMIYLSMPPNLPLEEALIALYQAMACSNDKAGVFSSW